MIQDPDDPVRAAMVDDILDLEERIEALKDQHAAQLRLLAEYDVKLEFARGYNHCADQFNLGVTIVPERGQ